ncbi:MAG: TrkH family potassium uptake protein, partial [Candidatus Sumerlaeia bacterium]|nr:TrkH family potassium uptake protein [Candidatus Sumerlaeia bacterium]
MNYYILCKMIGVFLGALTLSMGICIPIAAIYQEWGMLAVILESMLVGGIISGTLYFLGRNAKGDVFRREALATVGFCWLLAALVGGLPFYLAQVVPDFASAYFESASGLTTTGATIFTTVEDKPYTILFWRSFLHFLGGLGIVILFVAFIPLAGAGGRALFLQESTGPISEGMTPRIKDTSLQLVYLYVGLNAAQAILLMIFGMNLFDAVTHAMGTIATGGFSTKTSSILYYNSPAIEWIIIFFMYISGANFALHLDLLKGKFTYFRNTEFLVYTSLIFGVSLITTVALWITENPAVSNPGGWNFRDAMFVVTNLQSCTGFATVDYDQWPESIRIMLLMVLFVGGCAGSTGGAMKVIRFVILAKLLYMEILAAASPRTVRLVKLDGVVIQRETGYQILIFFFLYVSIAALGTMLIGLFMPGQSMITCFSG